MTRSDRHRSINDFCLLTIMDYLAGEQLSLIAEDIEHYAPGDWDVDNRFYNWKNGGQNKNRSLASMEGNGGQPQTVNPRMEGNGGQNKNLSQLTPCPPSTGSIFTRFEGDDGTWIEKQKRGEHTYKYLRWREGKTKRGKYLGKLETD